MAEFTLKIQIGNDLNEMSLLQTLPIVPSQVLNQWQLAISHRTDAINLAYNLAVACNASYAIVYNNLLIMFQ